MSPYNLYRFVVRDQYGNVQETHQYFRDEIVDRLVEATDNGHSVTITGLRKNVVSRPESCGVSGYKE